ncbi:30S ribosomal protein S27ae [Candidatus Woesearchaeota archaeon]|nr:30S ribosomal protein S27ae [Candidatus Woesearchaeota archaeon]
MKKQKRFGRNILISRNNHSCPKCGSGVFMGKHKDRLVCGKCRYVEFVKS